MLESINNKRLRTVLLLTGTIDPGGMGFTHLQDIETRRQQYVESIRFWVSNTFLQVVFIENSNNPLDADLSIELATGRLELLSFAGNDYPKSVGKGFGELTCLEYGIGKSQALATADFIFKATGRLRVLNFSIFHDFVTSFREIQIMVDFQRSLTFCDSRFFGFRPKFVKDYLCSFKNTVNDSKKIYFEHILARAALRAIADGYSYSPMPGLPRFSGESGSTGRIYDSSDEAWLQRSMAYNEKFILLTQK